MPVMVRTPLGNLHNNCHNNLWCNSAYNLASEIHKAIPTIE